MLKPYYHNPFGLTQKGYNNLTTSLGSAGAKKYQYNGKELQDDYGLEWYDYGARFYDAGLGRFIGIDPLADTFAFVTPYNYAENSPIANIDLWGLQKVFFQKRLNNNLNFGKVYKIQRQTKGGRAFTRALTNQQKFNAFYYEYSDALPAGKHNTFTNINDFKIAKNNDSYGVFKNIKESDIESAFEKNKKGVIAIGIERITTKDTDNKTKLAEKVFTLNHEEVAHGLEVLINGKQTKSNEEGHKFYFGKAEWSSPSMGKVLDSKDYNGKIAKDQAKEILKIIDKDEK